MRTLKVRDSQGQEFEVDEVNLSDAEKDGFLPVVENENGEQHRVALKDLELAEQDGYRPLVVSFEPESISKVESALRGAAQGASMEFADEVEARVRSFMGDSTYEDLLPQVRQQYAAAQEANPGTYLSSSLAGSFAVPVPGAGLLTAPLKAKRLAGALKAASKVDPKDASKALDIVNAAKKTSLGEYAIQGAVGGAIAGAGASEASDMGDIATDVVKGATIGTVAAPVVGRGLELGAKGISKAADMSVFGREAKSIFNLSRDTNKKYIDEVETTVAKLRAEGKSIDEIDAAIEKIPTPFGSVKTYINDQDELRKKASDLVDELTSPKGTGPLGMVNRKYSHAEALMGPDKVALEVQDLLNLTSETMSDEAAQAVGRKLIGKLAGSSKRAQTPEELAELARSEMAKQMRTELHNRKNLSKKESLDKAKKVLSKAGEDVDEIYRPQVQALYEKAKRTQLNEMFNTYKAKQKKPGKRDRPLSDQEIASRLANAENMLDSTMEIRRVVDKKTGNVVYEYSASASDDFKIIGTVPTKSNFENFGNLNAKEKSEAVVELANAFHKADMEAAEEAIKGLTISVNKIDDKTIEALAEVPISADALLKNKRSEFILKEIEQFNKNKLDFNEIQRLKGELSDAIEDAAESGKTVQKEELIALRDQINARLKETVQEKSPEAAAKLAEADALRRNIVSNDVRLILNNRRFNPLSKAQDSSEKQFELDQMTRRVESLMLEEPKALASSKKTELRDAIKGVQELIDQGVPEAPALMSKLNDTLDTANRTYLAREMFETQGMPDATAFQRFGMPVKSALLKGTSLAGSALGRVESSKFGKISALVNADSQVIRELANKVQSPMLKRYLNTMAEADAPKRKALMFVILQNGPYKQELEDEIDFNEEN